MATLPVEFKERLAKKRVSWYVADTGYDIKVIDNDDLTRAMSHVKWPTPKPSGLTTVDLIDGPAVGLLWLVVRNFPSYIGIKPLLSFLKDKFCNAGLGSTTPKTNLIENIHEEGTLSGSSKGKEPTWDIREGTL
ncbi:La-related protein 6 [Hordeum vulgare]|nr:La-related protein 6 [Hordeum vulgare]